MSNDYDWMRNYVKYSSILLQLIITIVIGIFFGYKLDQWLHTKPIFLILFTVIFSAIAFYITIRQLLQKK